jgi:hypothetical protein
LADGTLAALGWTDELEAAFKPYAERGFMPARVVAEHRGGYYVRSELGDRLASARGRLRDDELWGGMPAVGDWVVVVDAPGDRFAIEALLPRRTKVSRKTPWLKAEEHILVANVDAVWLVSGLDQDFNPRRLERYLTAAWDSGADPVIVLTKLDICDEPTKLAEAETVAVGVPVYAVSNVTGEGIDAVRELLQPAKTFVLLGSSGSGKSTLVNRLAGRTVMHADGRASQRRSRPPHDPSPPAARNAGWRHPDRHARVARAADLGGRHRQRVRGHRGARRAVPVRRLRALDGARLRGARGTREWRARRGSLGELREAPAGAARDRDSFEPAPPARAQESLAGARPRDPARSSVWMEAVTPQR